MGNKGVCAMPLTIKPKSKIDRNTFFIELVFSKVRKINKV
jgi:hypothetical protein